MMKKAIIAIVISLLVVLVGVALFSVVRSHRVAHVGQQMGVCVNAMEQLVCAKEQWAMTTRATNGTPVPTEETLPYLKDRKMPVCPSGGDYIVGTVGRPPACTVHGDRDHYHRPGMTTPWPYGGHNTNRY